MTIQATAKPSPDPRFREDDGTLCDSRFRGDDGTSSNRLVRGNSALRQRPISRGIRGGALAQGRARRQLGFTLLEIMIVTALLAVIAAITIPRLDFRRSDVGVARNELQGLVRVLRVEASATGKPHRLRIDVGSGWCFPEVLEGDHFEPMQDTLGHPQKLAVDRILGVITASRAPTLGVHPGGFVEPALVEVQVDGETSTLAVQALTGRVGSRAGGAQER